MKTARETLGHLGKWGRGRLRLGASTTACQHIIPPVLREFKESFPEHAITIEPGDTLQLTYTWTLPPSVPASSNWTLNLALDEKRGRAQHRQV